MDIAGSKRYNNAGWEVFFMEIHLVKILVSMLWWHQINQLALALKIVHSINRDLKK